MNTQFYTQYTGVLSDRKIQEALDRGDIFIAPFDKNQLQPAGYNLTPTRFFYSTKKQKFLTIVENSDEVYVIIDKNDTVLVRTRESIAVSSALSGAFYSKVKVVSEGFGHVSTTLDPYWEGQLLISLNNPTNRKLKFSIEKKVYGKTIYNSFVTLEFTGLDSVPLERSDNPPGRLDILNSTIENNISTFKRKQIEELQDLLVQLHRCEECTIDILVLNRLNSEELERRNEIYAVHDDKTFDYEWSKFLLEKRKKYFRFIKEDFAENALKSIEIINTYINQKQKYLPIRTKILRSILDNKYRFIGIMLSIVMMMCLIFLGIYENFGADEQVSTIVGALIENHQEGILYTIFSGCIIYIIFPIVKELFIDQK